MIILGIDPGTTTIGYGLIQKEDRSVKLLDYGVIETTPKIPLIDKMREAKMDFLQLFEWFDIERVVIEKIYFSTNLKTGIDVAQMRGMILSLCLEQNMEILEYTPLELKSAICGNGKASKWQLQKAIMMLLGLSTLPTPDDAADAIGLAYMWYLQK